MRIGIIGVGGWAGVHLRVIGDLASQGECRLEAAVIRSPAKYEAQETELSGRGVRIYRDYHAMLAEERGALDLVVVPGGIDQHEPQSTAALDAGFHVLCEKPAAGTSAEAVRMLERAEGTGRILAIGYQHLHSHAVQQLKRLAVEGRLGGLLRASMVSYQPRSSAYYGRNSWAGKMSVNGRTILDSPLQNAMAHYLNNMLYIAGRAPGESASPRTVSGENYRAKEIESADTQAIRIETRGGVVLTGAASHAVLTGAPARIRFTFERGTAEWSSDGCTRITARGGPGAPELWRHPEEDLPALVYRDLFRVLTADGMPVSHIGNAFQHTLCLEALFRSCPTAAIPADFVQRRKAEHEVYSAVTADENAANVAVRGLEQTLERMFEQEKSFAETGVPWAVRGKPLPLPQSVL